MHIKTWENNVKRQNDLHIRYEIFIILCENIKTLQFNYLMVILLLLTYFIHT